MGSASLGAAVELVPHLREELSDLGLATGSQLDRVQNGQCARPEHGGGFAIARVLAIVLPVRRENGPNLELRFRDVVHPRR